MKLTKVEKRVLTMIFAEFEHGPAEDFKDHGFSLAEMKAYYSARHKLLGGPMPDDEWLKDNYSKED